MRTHPSTGREAPESDKSDSMGGRQPWKNRKGGRSQKGRGWEPTWPRRHACASPENFCGSISAFQVKAQAGQDPAGFGLCSGRPGGPQFLIHLGGEEDTCWGVPGAPHFSSCPLRPSPLPSRASGSRVITLLQLSLKPPFLFQQLQALCLLEGQPARLAASSATTSGGRGAVRVHPGPRLLPSSQQLRFWTA